MTAARTLGAGRVRFAPAVVALWALAGCASTGGPSAADGAPDVAPPTVQPAAEGPTPTGGLTGADPGTLDPILDSPWVARGDAPREIRAWEDYFTGRGRAEFQLYLERMGRWDSLVVAHVEEAGLPPSLLYLPVIESGYSPTAVSHARAVGMWQFMAGTARGYGLTVTPLVDERRDPWMATPWALEFLTGLSASFGGSWHLALAGYNAGPGRVDRILRRYAPGVEPSDSLYWALRDRFPRETRAFVPKFIAAARIAGDPAAWGFTDYTPHAPLDFELVMVPDAMSLDVAARAAEVPQRSLEELNPHLLRGLTPAGQETHLRIPPGQGEVFLANYERIPPNERVSFVEHRVESGETFSHIARRYGVSVADVRAANPRIQPRRIQIGQRIVVPTAPSAREALRTQVADAGDDAAPPGSAEGGAGGGSATTEGDSGSGAVRPAPAQARGATTTLVHEVRSGESLWSVANQYGVTIAELREWNRIPEGALLYPGDDLVVHAAMPAEYVVRSGDTLSAIARRYGVSTRDLARANGLDAGGIIRPGDRLRLPGGGTGGG
jgi:membrane-bound lytic murein transglycosylase D